MVVDVLWEDGPALVVLKPAGVLTQAPPGIDNLETQIREFLKQRDGRTGNIYLGIPHRLDRPASGALVFGKHVRATRRLADQFEARTVRKIYWACTQGFVEPESGTWIDHMRKVHGRPHAEMLPADDPTAQRAVLHYRTLARQPHGSWLEIELETGRTHQIRLQAASRGYPLLGDEQYGATTLFGEPFDDARLRAIALHARTLGFQHPVTREPVEVTAPTAAAWRELLGEIDV